MCESEYASDGCKGAGPQDDLGSLLPPLSNYATSRRTIEVILVDRDRLTRESEVNGVWRHDVLGGLERELPFLGDADEHDALVCQKTRAIPIGDVFFTLAAFELNHRHHVLIGEGGDGLDEAIVEWAKRGR